MGPSPRAALPLGALILLGWSLGCDGPDPAPTREVDITRQWTSETFDGCVLASPLAYESASGTRVVVASGDGRISALDPADGGTTWTLALPAPEGQRAHLIATPVIVARRLVVAWQDVDPNASDPAAAPRSAHHVAVVDLDQAAFASDFPTVTLRGAAPSADGTSDVLFRSENALSRARLVHAPSASPEGLGHVYVSFGNARDIQPWHGWIFELNLDAWRAAGPDAAISALLLTSPTNDCGPAGMSGSTDTRCGAGVWAPAGPQLAAGPDGGFSLLVPTGNGALDLTRETYAHALMRVAVPGLAFDPGCDAVRCADFDAQTADPECLASCRHLFIPRLLDGEPPLDAPGCEGLSFFACYAALDWDLGANAPAPVTLPSGRAVYVLPAKDGAVYLIDATHLGTMLDRREIARPCGSGGASCTATWAGMMVTQPVVSGAGPDPLAIVVTFEYDDRNPAGLVALRIHQDVGEPRLEVAWRWPELTSSTLRFRRHPGGLSLIDVGGLELVAVVEQGRLGDANGQLHLVRAHDGTLAATTDLMGPGQRYAVPLWTNEMLIVNSCDHGNAGPGHVEAYRVTPAP